MSSLVRALVVVPLLVGAVSLLNPCANGHHQKIKEGVAERSQLAALLRLGDMSAFVSSHHALGLALYTPANEKVLAMGAFGLVGFGSSQSSLPAA